MCGQLYVLPHLSNENEFPPPGAIKRTSQNHHFLMSLRRNSLPTEEPFSVRDRTERAGILKSTSSFAAALRLAQDLARHRS